MKKYDVILNKLPFETLEYHEGVYVYLMAKDPKNGSMLFEEMKDKKGITLHFCSFEKELKIKVLETFLNKIEGPCFCNVSKDDLNTKLIPLEDIVTKLTQSKAEEWGLD